MISQTQMSPSHSYERAQDLEHAWANFELDMSLPPVDGQENPFYVHRPDEPLAKLLQKLVLPSQKPPKIFFSGLRGSGKSTELQHLAAHEEITSKYYPLFFSIRDDVNPTEIDHRDVLLSIASHLYDELKKRSASTQGKEMRNLEKNIESWQGMVQKEITTRLTGPVAEYGFNVSIFNIGAQLKMEPETRSVLRQVIKRNILDLVKLLDTIARVFQEQTKRMPLILIDDLDKLEYAQAKALFQEQYSLMLSPEMAIVYTVSSGLFYSEVFDTIRDHAEFLPNILVGRRESQTGRWVQDETGYEVMRAFVERRMSPRLIEPQALDLAIRYSGGVFREMARLIRKAISRARTQSRKHIIRDDVQGAIRELRNEYVRILRPSDRQILDDIYKKPMAHDMFSVNDRLRILSQVLAVLEYPNHYMDVHPVLWETLNENPA